MSHGRRLPRHSIYPDGDDKGQVGFVMQQLQDYELATWVRYAIALAFVIALHGAALMFLAGMRHSEPQKPRIMVGMLLKAPEQKRTPAPQPAPETPVPESPKPQPPEPAPQIQELSAPPARTKAEATKKPAPKVKPTRKPHPKPVEKQEVPRTPVAEPVSHTPTVLQTAAVTASESRLSAPQFYADYLHNPDPKYPLMSRKRREEGEVQLRVRVDAQGHPETVQIQVSSGHPRLDQAASSAVKQWRFVPARQGGLNVAAWVVVPIQFNLEK